MDRPDQEGEYAMPLLGKILKPEDAGRKVGLVYSDDALSAGPAAHALVIGVAAYQSPKYRKVLHTAAISARTVADWFVDAAKARFANPACGLGSLAVLLSETAGVANAAYAGGAIPRAIFADAKAAVRAWVDRINAHKDNLAILYVASHGESFLNRTAFLLEDYGMDPHDTTAGMVEVEQLVGALENAVPVAQLLLFDCCRNPTAAELPWGETIGSKLIALTRRPDDHGEPRKQWVICSTSLGKYAGGLATGPTLFNMALIEALNGVASDPSAEGWPVRPGLLVDKIDRLLALHRLPDEKAQTPAGRMAGSFEITFPGEPKDVPIYVTLNDPAEWPESTINVTINGAPAEPIKGAEGESPFHVRRVPELAVVEVEAARHNASLGRAKAKVYPPATFLAIEKHPAVLATEVGQLPSFRGRTRGGGAPRVGGAPTTRAKLIISVDSQASIPKGAVATIVRRAEPTAPPLEVAVDIGGETTLDLEPGDLTITLRTPDARAQTRDITLADKRILRVPFTMQPSPHEWMIAAAIAGAISAPAGEPEAAAGAAPRRRVGVEIVGGIDMDLNLRPSADAGMRIAAGSDDGRFARFDVQDEREWRFVRDMPPSAPSVVARVTMGGRMEFAVIPTLGRAGRYTIGGWTPFLLIDRRAAPNEHVTAVIVEDSKWAGLLGFLASREIAAAAKLLDSDLGEIAVEAIADKLGNPLAAVAGALIAVATSNAYIEKKWDPWVANIAKWFRDIPDGPIVLGRRLLMRARTEDEIAEARRWFVEGFQRGVPFYSLAVDWLARGLESIPGDDEDLGRMQRVARALSGRVDPTRTFTVMRASDGAA
jgi:hypothetical protein